MDTAEWIATAPRCAKTPPRVPTRTLTDATDPVRLLWDTMSTTFNSPAGTVRPDADGQELVDRHFLEQELLPTELRRVELTALDPLLRLLVFSDGSVTRALSVHCLDPVKIELVDQVSPAAASATISQPPADPGRGTIRRRVVMSFRSASPGSPPSGFAESHLEPGRLPPSFLRDLHSGAAGIGDAIASSRLEVHRELLWFGLGPVPAWVPSLGGRALVRAYRIVAHGSPAILIREGFRVRFAHRRYTLVRPSA